MKRSHTALVVLTALAPISAAAFEVSSPDIPENGAIPEIHALNTFGCTGENISPTIAWTDAPEGTESFAIFVHDGDVETGGAGFWHWVVIDIPAENEALPQGAGSGEELPDGARQMTTDFGAPGWGGPCPPEPNGPHNYNFTVYALPVAQLEVPDGATASLTGFVVNQMALASATFSATYDR